MANSTLTVSFSTTSIDEDISLSVELDEAANKAANNGRTSSFLFGDSVYFNVYSNPQNVSIENYTSDGNVVAGINGTTEQEEFLIFSQPDIDGYDYPSDEYNETSLETPCTGSFSSVALSASANGTVAVSPDDIETARKSIPGVAVYKANYESDYQQFCLTNVTQPPAWEPTEDDSSYPVTVIIVGSLID